MFLCSGAIKWTSLLCLGLKSYTSQIRSHWHQCRTIFWWARAGRHGGAAMAYFISTVERGSDESLSLTGAALVFNGGDGAGGDGAVEAVWERRPEARCFLSFHASFSKSIYNTWRSELIVMWIGCFLSAWRLATSVIRWFGIPGTICIHRNIATARGYNYMYLVQMLIMTVSNYDILCTIVWLLLCQWDIIIDIQYIFQL